MSTTPLPVPLPTQLNGSLLSTDELVYVVGLLGASNENIVARDGGLNVQSLYRRLYATLNPADQLRAFDTSDRFRRYIRGTL